MKWKTILLAIAGISLVVTALLGILAWIFIFSPKEKSYLAEYTQKETNIRSEIKTLRGTIGGLTESVKDRPTYQVVYGMRTNEQIENIPVYIRSLQMSYSLDSTGTVGDVKTMDSYKMFVPPHADWRRWQKLEKTLKYVPRQLISVDTTFSQRKDGKLYFYVIYRFEPVFEPITEGGLLTSMGNLGNKILKDKIEAGEIETINAKDGEKVAETKKETAPAVKSEKKQPPTATSKLPTLF